MFDSSLLAQSTRPALGPAWLAPLRRLAQTARSAPALLTRIAQDRPRSPSPRLAQTESGTDSAPPLSALLVCAHLPSARTPLLLGALFCVARPAMLRLLATPGRDLAVRIGSGPSRPGPARAVCMSCPTAAGPVRTGHARPGADPRTLSAPELKCVSISARRPPLPPPPQQGLPACTDRWCSATAPTPWPRALSSSRSPPERPAAS